MFRRLPLQRKEAPWRPGETRGESREWAATHAADSTETDGERRTGETASDADVATSRYSRTVISDNLQTSRPGEN